MSVPMIKIPMFYFPMQNFSKITQYALYQFFTKITKTLKQQRSNKFVIKLLQRHVNATLQR